MEETLQTSISEQILKIVQMEDMPESEILEASVLLAEEFYSADKFKYGINRFYSEISTGDAEVYVLKNGREVIGISTMKQYPFERISNQLYYAPIRNGLCISGLRLIPFEALLSMAGFCGDYSIVSELGYNFVRHQFRGQGFGRVMFDLRVKKVKEMGNSQLIFGIVRSRFAGSANQIFEHFLQMEQAQNGMNGKLVTVTGVPISVDGLEKSLKLDLSELSLNSGVQASAHLMASESFTPIGFAKNLSPLWVKET